MHIYVCLTWACACTIRRVHYPLPMAPREAAPAAVVQPRGAVYVAQPAVITQPAAITPSHPDDARSISARPLLRQYDDLLREKASDAEPTSVCPRPPQALSPARSQVLWCPSPRTDHTTLSILPAVQDEVQAAYERLQRDSSREIAKVRRRSEELAQQLETQAEQMTTLQSELMAQGGEARVVERLRAKLQRVEQQSSEEVTTLQRALGKYKKEVILLNSELSRSKREEERLRRHVRQLEAELKVVQRRTAASSTRDGSRQVPRPSGTASAPGSRAGSRPPSASASRVPFAARSTANSRASSVASSATSSRAGSVERGAAGSRSTSRPASRSASVEGNSRSASNSGSRAGSADRSQSASRASSQDSSRPPSRDSRSRAGAPPSIERAAREALLQTTTRRTALPPGTAAASRGPSGGRAGAPRPERDTEEAPNATRRRGLARRGRDGITSDDRGSSSEEWVSSSARPRTGRQNDAAKYDDAHKENRGHSDDAERPRAVKAVPFEGEKRPMPSLPQQYDATDDIQDIDRRLNALQQFLEAAKAPR